MLAAQREGNRLLAAALSELDVTPAQSEALRIIEDHGPLSLRQLGEMLVCDTGTSPSRIVDRLVAAGLVDRAAGEQDRRQVQLSLTPAGTARATQVRTIEERLYDSIDGALADEDADELVHALRALTHDSPAGAALQRRLTPDHASA
ncbi:MarR family transcriptional regulator [Microbacterium sp. ARD32]|uniref:MarR family winged helix-turn-helix transcriptional regulator n=1 Tax=Microbacterium sp. ARD32 TaxID=2962577 RepID=UPI002882862D|nr:MarR family transcriptional regulator [Microbacterium sp. ARD32]MDT0157125.1 MarR family transcriptional regulator [Microbacterium sp. ARD32]